MTSSFYLLLQFHKLTAVGLFATLCHSPNPLESILIVAALAGMVLGLVLLVPVSAVTMIFLANTIVDMIMAGATVESIGAAITAQLGTVGISLQVVSQFVEYIKDIMGC
jgi:hypothetical protein